MAEIEAKIGTKKLLFNKWDVSEVKVTDPGLIRVREPVRAYHPSLLW